MDTRLRQVAVTLGLAAVYIFAARFGFAFDPVSGFATLIWVPAGIALAAILLLGNRAAAGIFLGAFVANFFNGAGVPAAVGIGIGNTCEALVGAAILQRMPEFSRTLERVNSVVALIVWSAMLSTLIGATAGVATLHVAGIVPAEKFSDAWRAWWIGDMVGVLLIAPLILAWGTKPRAVRQVRWPEITAFVAALVVVCAATFFNRLLHLPALATPFHQADLLVAVLLWAAIRFGQRGATTALLATSVVALVSAALGRGPFVQEALRDRLLPLQTFTVMVTATALIIAATIAERRIADMDADDARRLAETANSAKTQFLRVMSHELRTPLNAIQGFAELLKTGVYGPLSEKQVEAVVRIEQNEKMLLAMINEMLGFVESERGPAATARTNVLVAEVFDAIEEQCAADVERKHLVMRRELVDQRLAVCADAKMLQQILASLVSNAIKYTADGGTITLAADGDMKKVRIWVRDTGIGIRKEEMERIFEPFFQADSGTTRQYAGVGLGLTIARDLARRMDGEVTITSEEGKGTSAMIVLPAGEAVAPEEPVRSPAQHVAA